MNCAAVLVAQLEVGHRIARRRHMVDDRGPVIRLALRDHHDVVQQHVGIGVLRDQHVRGDHVAGMQFAENAADPSACRAWSWHP